MSISLWVSHCLKVGALCVIISLGEPLSQGGCACVSISLGEPLSQGGCACVSISLGEPLSQGGCACVSISLGEPLSQGGCACVSISLGEPLSQGGCACVSISLGEPLSQALSEGMSLHARGPHSTSSGTAHDSLPVRLRLRPPHSLDHAGHITLTLSHVSMYVSTVESVGSCSRQATSVFTPLLPSSLALLEDSSLLSLCLTVMRGYQRLSPSLFVQADFNPAKLLPSLSQLQATATTSSSCGKTSVLSGHLGNPAVLEATLRLLEEAPSDYFKWKQQVRLLFCF